MDRLLSCYEQSRRGFKLTSRNIGYQLCAMPSLFDVSLKLHYLINLLQTRIRLNFLRIESSQSLESFYWLNPISGRGGLHLPNQNLLPEGFLVQFFNTRRFQAILWCLFLNIYCPHFGKKMVGQCQDRSPSTSFKYFDERNTMVTFTRLYRFGLKNYRPKTISTKKEKRFL